MGYFAVLKNDVKDNFEVEQCHVNIWVLAGMLPARYLLYFDVGVKIKALVSTDPDKQDSDVESF